MHQLVWNSLPFEKWEIEQGMFKSMKGTSCMARSPMITHIVDSLLRFQYCINLVFGYCTDFDHRLKDAKTLGILI